MRHHTLLLLVAVTSVIASGLTQAAQPAGSNADRAAHPDLSGVWAHTSITGFEPLAKGPTSVTNLSRRGITSDNRQLVGNYRNPILKPETADIVKKHGETSLAGIGYPTPRNQCWPGGIPFVFTTTNVRIAKQLMAEVTRAAVIQKPYALEELHALVNEAIASYQRPTGPAAPSSERRHGERRRGDRRRG